MSRPVSRHVNTLRIRAAGDDLAQRTAFVLGDALRCASLPDDARCYFFRRLQLPRTPANLSSQAYSALLEQGLAELARSAVDGRSARAGDADGVVFAERAAALAQVLAGVVAGQPPRWFWAAAAPGWRADLPPADALARIVENARERPEGAAEIAAAIATLPVPQRHVLQRSLSERQAPHAPASGTDPTAPATASGQNQTAVVAATDGSAVAHAAPAESPRTATSRVIHCALPDPAGGPTPAAPGHIAAAAGESLDAARSPVLPSCESPARPAVSAEQQAVDMAASTLALPLPAADPADRHPGLPDSPWQLATPPATAHAGLLFVLNALSRLGLPDWLARHPDTTLPLRLLYDLAQRLRLPADDPQARWLAEACAELDLAGSGLAGSNLAEPSLAEPSLAEPSLDRALAGWRQTLRRACRVNAGIALADLARRPGRILITATHLDVWLDPSMVDLRIRRAGLDLDPGWLPWLGRVVRFHYDASGRDANA